MDGESKYSTRKKIIDFAKIGEKLSLTGSNCHYCKTVMTVKESNACRYTLSSSKSKRKTCNKKFCFDCLEKNFPVFWETRNNKDWKCPCCCGECICNQCKKNMLKVVTKESDVSFDSSFEEKKASFYLTLKGSSKVLF